MARRGARPDPARAAPGVEPAVTWRDGAHIAGTPIWCDARRARDVCFVSRADALSAARHGQLVGTAPTLALASRGPLEAASSVLAVPCGRPFTLGTRRLELVPTGGVIGGAGLLVDVDGRRVFYAGSVCPRGVGLGAGAEVRHCDALVLAAVQAGGAQFDPAAAAAAAVDFTTSAAAAGDTPVLLVNSPSRGLDVAAALAAAGVPVRAHRSVHHAARRLAPLGLPAGLAAVDGEGGWLRRARPRRAAGPREALVWMLRHRHALERLQLERPRIALVAGAAAEPDAVAAAGAAIGFAWSSHGDRDDLIAYIEETGASSVFLTGRFAEPLAAALDGRGRSVRQLGPPRQMSLFT